MTGKWTVVRNDGGAYLCLDGMEIAHVGNVWSSDYVNSHIPMNGVTRAEWLCGILNRKSEGDVTKNEN